MRDSPDLSLTCLQHWQPQHHPPWEGQPFVTLPPRPLLQVWWLLKTAQSTSSAKRLGTLLPCMEGRIQLLAAAASLLSQGGGFTLSPPQIEHDKKKAGGGPAWGLPASQDSPGDGLGDTASLPGPSVACPRRRAPSQLEGHPVGACPPKSVAELWSELP